MLRPSVSPHVSAPADLPFNIPDVGRYPVSRYDGLRNFAGLLSPGLLWEFITDLGGKRDETPLGSFWTQAFDTKVVLRAYFRLPDVQRVYFTQHVSWVRDPLPGRPGGVQVVPPTWPGNLPTPVRHSMTRYAGLAEWVASIPEAWAEVCRMSLFGIHETFDPIWWSDYHKTVDVYDLYSKISPSLRAGFLSDVSWIPDGPVGGLLDSVDEVVGEDGFTDEGEWVSGANTPRSDRGSEHLCYLRLFRPEHRENVRRVLGSNPWGPSLASELLRETGRWSPGTFGFSVGARDTKASPAFVQAHVEPSADGCTVAQLVPWLSGYIRVGATSDLNALIGVADTEPLAVQPTVFPERPLGGGSGMELSFNIWAKVGSDQVKYPNVTFSVMQEPTFVVLLGAYESVQLVSAAFNYQISIGSTNDFSAAICGPKVSLSGDDDWLSTPINTMVSGSDQGPVSGVFELPRIHPFQTELRSPLPVGNPVPSFRFGFTGSTGSGVVIRGRIVVRVRGQFALGHLRIGGSKSGTKNNRLRIAQSLSGDALGTTRKVGPEALEQGNVGGDSDDDSEDSDAGGPVARASPARRANVGVTRD